MSSEFSFIEILKEKEKQFQILLNQVTNEKLKPVYLKVLGKAAQNMSNCYADPKKNLEASSLCASEINERLSYFLGLYKDNLVFYEGNIEECTSGCRVALNMEVFLIFSLALLFFL